VTRSDAPTLSSHARAGANSASQREIDEVAGDRDVIRPLRLHVRHQRIEHVALVDLLAVAFPVEIAERALAGEVGKPQAWQRRKMRIGQMGERECRHQPHPLLLPVRWRRCTIIP
jgi:hypothetical protein